LYAGRTLLLLLIVAVGLATRIGSPIVGIAFLPFIATLLASHIDRESGSLARLLVRGAARLLPADRRDDERDEWLDHVEAAGERGVLPISRALSVALIAAPLLAVGLRVGRSRRATR
jgi:hypothetical protein